MLECDRQALKGAPYVSTATDGASCGTQVCWRCAEMSSLNLSPNRSDWGWPARKLVHELQEYWPANK